MRVFTTIIAAFALAATLVAPASAPAQGTSARPIDQLSWMAGSTWIADASAAGAGMQRIETTYEWAPNKAFIRFATTFASTTGSFVNYSGDIFAGPTGAYAMWYMDAKGNITQGPIVVGSGGDWSSQFADSESGTTYRVSIARSTADAYTWTLASQAGTAWKTELALKFIRSR